MPELDDITLLKQYAGGDESAFTALFERRVHLVYSAALRQTRNPSHAEEVTQAVFILLARKAKSLSPKTVLSGWLYQAARLTTASLIRREIRRQRREQEVYMQSLTEPDTSPWEQISPMLDDAMSRLGETDRNAIILRYFENRTPQDVAAALKLNDVTARKRVSRALEKLRTFFAKRGVVLSAANIAGTLSGHSVHAAPAALANSATAVMIAKGAAASIPALGLSKTTAIALTMKTKTIVTTAIVATLLVGSGAGRAYWIWHQNMPRVTVASTLPMTFTNAIFKQDGDRDGSFTVDLDTKTLRTSISAPAIHIKGPVGLPNHPRASGTADNSASTVCLVGPGSPLLGKRICVTGWLKSRNVQGWASAFLLIGTQDFKSKGWSRADSMSDRPIMGTTDWQQVKFVTDLPDQPCGIYFGPDLYGPGELWGDDFQISLAGPDDAITDDRAWQQNSDKPGDYTVTTDPATTHDGSPTLRFEYTGPDKAAGNSWTWLGHDLRYPENEKYVGHTVRLSGWIKTENASGHLQPQIRPGFGLWGGDYKLLAKDSMVHDHSLSGTMDWTQFSLTCDIPKNTGCIVTSFIFFGGGKVWLDTNSLALTIEK